MSLLLQRKAITARAGSDERGWYTVLSVLGALVAFILVMAAIKPLFFPALSAAYELMGK